MSITAETVAVVGVGAVYPGAADASSFWRNIVAGTDAVTTLPAERGDPELFDFGCRRGGFVDGDGLWFDPARFGVMPRAATDTDPDQLLALATAAAALDDVGGGHGDHGVDLAKVGVVLGRGGYLTSGGAQFVQRVRTAHQLLVCLRTLLPDVGEERLASVKAEFLAELGALSPEATVGVMPNLAASRVANRLDFGGPAYVVDAACASSLVAVDAALRELQSGRCDLVLAGGVHHCDDLVLWAGFAELGALSPSSSIRPFDRQADGILIGEGTGMVALERLETAERRGHRVYALIRGSGIASDGRAASMLSPAVEGQVCALQRAYRSAGIDPGTVELVEGHGTATPAGDRAELETLRQVYGKSDDPVPPGVLGSVKSMIGHAMPAAGAAGLIKAVLAVYHGVLPPTLHAEDPHPALADTRFRLLPSAEPWESNNRTRRAGVNAFGFGGINAHVILESHGQGQAPAPAPLPGRRAEASWRLDAIRLSGADADDLAAQLADGRRVPHPERGGPARLAIVDPNPTRLDLAARVLAKNRPWRGLNDVWFEPEGLVSSGGDVAFVFPGVEPAFDADLDPVARWFERPLRPVPDGASPLEAQGHEILAAGRLLNDVLGDLGIAADHIAGHSMGEWTGWYAGELIPRTAADDYLDQLRPGLLDVPDVVYLALGCGAERAGELIAGLGDIVVSHDNCTHQSVVCGSPAAIETVKARLADGPRVVAQELPFRSGFHSPAFAPYLDRLRPLWDRMPLRTPRVPLWSATTAARYPDDPTAVRELAASHLVEPVRFRELTERLFAAGVRVFVQPGVGSLTGFIGDTLKPRPHVAIPAHTSARSGLDQLARVAAALWVEGVDVDFTPLAAVNPTLSATNPSLSATDPPSGKTQSSSRPAGQVQLNLGTQLVRLPAETRLDVYPASPGGGPVSATAAATALDASAAPPNLVSTHDALLNETLQAGKEVVTALAQRSTAVAHNNTALAHRSTALAHGGTATAGDEPTTRVTPLRVDMQTFDWLRDHCIIEQPPGWPDPSDGFPVLPLTSLIELLADAARAVAPGRVVRSIEDIQATRFVTADPPTTTSVRATAEAPDRVMVAIEGFARATVLLAAEAPPAPAAHADPLANPRPSPRTAEQLYSERWMFHGPSFHGVREVGPLGDNGIDGEVEVMATSGATLDSAAQLYGWWVLVTNPVNFFVLPQSIDRVELFGPLRVGQRAITTVRVTDVTDRLVRADLELSHEGRALVRITGSVVRRFNSDGHSWAMSRDPGHRLLSSASAEGFVTVDERWRDSASRELMAHRYLNAVERAKYRRLKPLAQRHWLLGRIAAKDAVRHALLEAGHGQVFPAEITVGNNRRGRPFVADAPGSGPDLDLSISHTSWVGAALARPHDGSGVGIDIEAVTPRSPEVVATVLTPTERAVLPDGDDNDFTTWLTRAWAAKEAAAKAAGTGLGGRLGDFPIVEVADGHRLLVGDRWISTVVRNAPVQAVADASTDTFAPDPAPPDVTADGETKEFVIAWTP